MRRLTPYLLRLSYLLCGLALVGLAHGQTVATPVLYPVGGGGLYVAFNVPASISLTSTTSGATIIYTTDGTTPGTSSGCTPSGTGTSLINGGTVALSVNPTTLQAIGCLVGDSNSAVASGIYNFDVAIPQFSPGQGTYTSSQTVSITSITSGAAIHYAINSQATCSSTLYTAPITVSVTERVTAIACFSGWNPTLYQATYNIGTFTAGTPSTDDNAYCGVGDVPLFPNDGYATGPQSCNYTPRSTSPSTSGTTWTVNTASDFTTALAGVGCGDKIVLTAGIVIQGTSFTYPALSCNALHWVTIRTSGIGSFPAEGTRVSPCYFGVASLPGRLLPNGNPIFTCSSTTDYGATIEGSGLASPLTISAGASFLRIEGIEFRPDPTHTCCSGEVPYLVNLSNGNNDHIVFDQVWGHGNANDETVRFVSIGGSTSPASHISFIDGFYTDFHCASAIGACTDAQVINGGLGVVGGASSTSDYALKIVNNFLEASGENILFGGSGGNGTPLDIETRLNYLFKPLTWDEASPTYNGGICNPTPTCGAPVTKNLVEMKNAAYVFVEGNYLQNNWAGYSQVGEAFAVTPVTQSGRCPNCSVTNLIYRYNYVSTVTQGYQVANIDGSTLGMFAYAGNSYSFHDQIFDDMTDPLSCGPNSPSVCHSNPETLGLGGYTTQKSYAPATLTLNHIISNHDTFVVYSPSASPPSAMTILIGPPGPLQNLLTIENSIYVSGTFGIADPSLAGTCSASQTIGNITSWLNACWTSWTFTHNAIVGGAHSGWNWPSGNFFPTTYSDVGFTNYNSGSGGNYQLLTSSPYHNAATDGLDLGANTVQTMALANYASGQLPTVATPTFSPAAGTYTSTQSVTISTSTPSATLCFTTDGSTPTANGSGVCMHGTTYSTAVSVASSETLQAVGSESGYSDSSVGSAVYVINSGGATFTFGSGAGSGTFTISWH